MEKPTDAAIDALHGAFPEDEGAVLKKMFGMPAGFIQGNMFMGVFGDGVVLRMTSERRTELMDVEGVGPFEPMGRLWKQYVWVSATVWGGHDSLAGWAREALAFTATLPAKAPKPRRKRA